MYLVLWWRYRSGVEDLTCIIETQGKEMQSDEICAVSGFTCVLVVDVFVGGARYDRAIKSSIITFICIPTYRHRSEPS